MLGKLLGKKSGYYLELPEEVIAAIPEPPATPAAPKAKAEASVVEASPTSETEASATTQKPAAAVPELAATISKASAAMPQEPAVPQPMSDPLELIRTALAASANQPVSDVDSEPQPTFDYTTPVAKARRRRPGPSMSPFKTIAKDMKKTNAGF